MAEESPSPEREKSECDATGDECQHTFTAEEVKRVRRIMDSIRSVGTRGSMGSMETMGTMGSMRSMRTMGTMATMGSAGSQTVVIPRNQEPVEIVTRRVVPESLVKTTNQTNQTNQMIDLFRGGGDSIVSAMGGLDGMMEYLTGSMMLNTALLLMILFLLLRPSLPMMRFR